MGGLKALIGWPLRDRQQPQAGKNALWVEERCKQRPRGSKAVGNQEGFTEAVAWTFASQGFFTFVPSPSSLCFTVGVRNLSSPIVGIYRK